MDIRKVISGFFCAVAFLLPLLFFLFPEGQYAATRFFVVLLVTAAAYSLWAWRNFKEEGLILTKFNFVLPFFLLFGMIILSTCLIPTAGGKNDAIPGHAGLFLISMAFFLAAISILKRDDLENLAFSFAASGVVLGGLTVFSFFRLVNKLVPAIVFNQLILVAGENAYYLAAYFAIFLIFMVACAFRFKKWAWLFILAIVVAILSFVSIALSLARPEYRAAFFPVASGWAVTVDIFKNLKSLLIGIGFNQFLPFSTLPQTPGITAEMLGMRFPETSNAVFSLLNSLGLLGFGAFFAVFFILIRFIYTNFSSARMQSLPISLCPAAAILISFFFLPLNPFVTFFLFFFLAGVVIELKMRGTAFEEKKLNLVSAQEGIISIQSLEQTRKESRQYAPKVFAGMISLIFVILIWQTAFFVIAEVHFNRARAAVANNLGKVAYDEAFAAVANNPDKDTYRVTLSQINYQLALSINAKLVAQQQEEKKINDQDRRNLTILLNQAVAQANQAVTLSPTKVFNWENLAGIYAGLIKADQNAGNLGANAFINAISLDPANPVLRVSYSQLLYNLKLYNQAVTELLQAVNIKSDYINAYYNLALNYKGLGDTEKAKTSLNLALKLAQKGSDDEKFLQEELTRIEEGEAAQAETPIPTAAAVVTPSPGALSEPQEPGLTNVKQELLQLQKEVTGTPTLLPTPTSEVTPTP